MKKPKYDKDSSSNPFEKIQMDRRDFLKSVAVISAGIAAQSLTGPVFAANFTTRSFNPKNLIILLTDQERSLQWFPDGWAEANLPAFTSLKNTGVLFSRAYMNTSMCTPSRNTLFTGLYPAQHLSKDTLTEGFVQSEAEYQLDPALPNLANILKSAGYEVVYKGKWHMSKGANGCDGIYQEDDLSVYGFDNWNPPDAGQDVNIDNFGGGNADNDERFMDDTIAYLESKINNPGSKPFCLIISLVNPHDVLSYPGLGTPGPWLEGGYSESDLEGDIQLPPTVDENLSDNYKPVCQGELLKRLSGLGVLGTEQRKLNYINFYGNLMKRSDSQFQRVLDIFNASLGGQALREQTWIVRTVDHGEMGLSHGGLRQKCFECYEENVRIPLIWSNPAEIPEGEGWECPHLVSHVDFLPTVCAMLKIPHRKKYGFKGRNYRRLIKSPNAQPVQRYLLFTFDDVYAGQNAEGNPEGVVPPPNRIQMIRTKKYKFARYFDINGVESDEQEFYDLRPAADGGTDTDPETGLAIEYTNYSEWADDQRQADGKEVTTTPHLARKRKVLKRMLRRQLRHRLKARKPSAPVPPVVQQRLVTCDNDLSAWEISWRSSISTTYQLQRSLDGGATWAYIGVPIPGNNGPIIICQPPPPSGTYYRVLWEAS